MVASPAELQEWERWLDTASSSHPNRRAKLSQTGRGYYTLFTKTRQRLHLEKTIQYLSDSLLLKYESDAERTADLRTIARCYISMFTVTGQVVHLDKAIQRREEALVLVSSHNGVQNFAVATVLHELGHGLLEKYNKTQSASDLELAIHRLQDAVAKTPHNDAGRIGRIHDLGAARYHKFAKTGTLADINTTIECVDSIYDITPRSHREWVNILTSLGTYFESKCSLTGDPADLSVAIERFREAADTAPVDHPARNIIFRSLMELLWKQVPQTGNRDTDAALQRTQAYLDLIQEDHRDYVKCLDAVVSLTEHKLIYGGTKKDYEMAIDSSKKALALTSMSDTGRVRRLCRLGQLYCMVSQLSEREGIEALGEAKEALQEALNMTDDDSTERPAIFGELGFLHAERLIKRGAMEDLTLAIRFTEQAQFKIPKTSPKWASYAQRLGTALQMRYLKTKAEADLNLSIENLREAVDMSTKDDLNLSARLKDLGRGYLFKYGAKKEAALLQEAIDNFRSALLLNQGNHVEQARQLNYLGESYFEKYKATGEEHDLDLSIKYHQEAFDDIPADDHYRTLQAHKLSDRYLHKYSTTKAQEDADKASAHLREFISVSPQSPRFYLMATEMLLRKYAKDRAWKQAYEVARALFATIPYVLPHSLPSSDKQHFISDFHGLASDAAAVALMAGEMPYRALELLELGRRMILGSLGDIRADVTDLQKRYPLVAAKYIECCKQLDNVEASHPEQDTMLMTQIDQRWQAGNQLEKTIFVIRSFPGFTRFLLPLTEDELKAAAAALSPIAVINVSRYRCDAILIEKGSLRTIRLHNLSISEIQTYQESLKAHDLIETAMLK